MKNLTVRKRIGTRSGVGALAVVAAAALALTACSGGGSGEASEEPNANTTSTAPEELVTVQFGSIGGLTDAGIYVAQARGYFEEQGIEVERNQMASSPDLMTALAGGDLDIAGLSLSVGLFNGIGQGLGVVMVGDKNSHQEFPSHEPFTGAQLMVSHGLGADDEQDAVARLVEKHGTIAITSATSINFQYVHDLLDEHGYTLDQVEVTEMAMGDMTAGLANGAVDAALISEPNIQAVLKADAGVLVSDLSSIKVPDVPLVPIAYSESFAADPELGKGWMLAYMHGVRDYLTAYLGDDEADLLDVQQIIAEASDTDLETVQAATPGGLSPDQNIEASMYDDIQQFFVDQGLMDAVVDLTDAVDTSYAEYAREQLGEFTVPGQ